MKLSHLKKCSFCRTTLYCQWYGGRSSPRKAGSLKGREDRKKRNVQNRVLHSVKGGFKKTKAAQRPNKQIFCCPGNQMKLLENY